MQGSSSQTGAVVTKCWQGHLFEDSRANDKCMMIAMGKAFRVLVGTRTLVNVNSGAQTPKPCCAKSAYACKRRNAHVTASHACSGCSATRLDILKGDASVHIHIKHPRHKVLGIATDG